MDCLFLVIKRCSQCLSKHMSPEENGLPAVPPPAVHQHPYRMVNGHVIPLLKIPKVVNGHVIPLLDLSKLSDYG